MNCIYTYHIYVHTHIYAYIIYINIYYIRGLVEDFALVSITIDYPQKYAYINLITHIYFKINFEPFIIILKIDLRLRSMVYVLVILKFSFLWPTIYTLEYTWSRLWLSTMDWTNCIPKPSRRPWNIVCISTESCFFFLVAFSLV